MKKGDVMSVEWGGVWIRFRVLTPLPGYGGVLLAGRRLSDGQRFVLYRDGGLVEVPG